MHPTMNCSTCGDVTNALSPCPRCLLDGVSASQPGTPVFEAQDEDLHDQELDSLSEALPEYQAFSLLAEGGMGTVYRATHRNLGRDVAIKVLKRLGEDPGAFRERFAREARALARLDHPSIVRVYESGEANGRPYLVMEFVEGATVRALLEGGRLSPSEVLEIIPQICSALAYAHRHGVVHRDVKPENILIDEEGRVRIADFGLAKLSDDDSAGTRLTRSDQVMGTPHYMAPEQLERPNDVDHRADIFSLGVVFYEMLTGELPLGTFAPPSHRSTSDARLDPVVLRSLERDPVRRYQQVNEIDAALKAASATQATSLPRNPRHSNASRAVRAGLLVVALVAVVALVHAILEPGDSPGDTGRQAPGPKTATERDDPSAQDLALVRAASRGDSHGVCLALEAGANVNAVLDRRTTPPPPFRGAPFALAQAAQGGHLTIVRLLLDHGAIPDLSGDDTAERAVHAASSRGFTDIVRLLFDKFADLGATDPNGRSPLLLALNGKHWETAEMIAGSGSVQVRTSIESSWDATSSGPSDRALHLAVKSGRLSVVKAVLAAGADPSAMGRLHRDSISDACEVADVRILEVLLEARPQSGRLTGYLLDAVRAGHRDNVRALIAAGADVNGEPGGTTPLMLTCFGSKLAIAKELLKRGADPDKLHSDGKTSARSFAVAQQRKDLLELFDKR